MKKQIKKLGNSFVIIIDKELRQWLNLKEGDFVDIGDIVKLKEVKGGIRK
jgi:antitoxin component of MazEF toxin-antitoxin module